MQQHVRPLKHLADVKVQCWTIDPIHEQDREPLAADEYSFGCVGEMRQVRNWRAPEMFLDRSVSLIAIAEITAKAANRKIATTIHRLEFVYVGKLARGHERHSQA